MMAASPTFFLQGSAYVSPSYQKETIFVIIKIRMHIISENEFNMASLPSPEIKNLAEG